MKKVKTNQLSSIDKATILISLLWLFLVFFTFWRIKVHSDSHSRELAIIEAQSSYNKDLVYRRWAALHGGVYVPITEDTPPNPHLSHLENRDIVTTNGERMTLINPAYMTRQVQELAVDQYGAKGHITSLNPIRPENAPDDWERESLQKFQEGVKSVNSVELMDGVPYLRYMEPMVTEESCLNCHGIQGYQLGDIRGGISVSVPFQPYQAIAEHHRDIEWHTTCLIGLFGLVGIFLGSQMLKRSRQKILDSSNRLELAIAGGELGTWDWNILTDHVFFNRRLIDMLGYRPDEFKPHLDTWEKLIHPDDLYNVKKVLRTHIDGLTDNYQSEHRLRHKDGHWIWVLDKGRVIEKNARGEPIRACGTHLDITERKEAEARLEQIFNKMIDGLAVHEIICDESGHPVDYRFLNINPSFEKLTGLGRDIIGKSVLEVLPGTENHWIETYGEVALTGKEVSFENYSSELGKYFEVRAFRHAPGQFTCIFVDITDRKESLDNLTEQNKRYEALNQQLQVTNEALREAKEKAEAASHAKGEFLALISHELRTPLNPILGFANILGQSLDEQPYSDYVNSIIESSEHMIDLIDDILDFSRLQKGVEMNFEPVRIFQLVNEVVSSSKINQGSNTITLENGNECGLRPLDKEISILSDERSIRQILVNLLSNACKYTQNGTISVTMGISETSGEELIEGNSIFLCFQIRDTGIGIPEDKLKSIFDPFIQVDLSYTRSFGGVGLGLAICKRLSELLDGSIEVESEPDKGSLFSFKLSAKLVDYTGSPTDVSAQSVHKLEKLDQNWRILLTEDNIENQNYIRTVIKKLGGTVTVAGNGREAITLLENDKFDLVFMDLSMPVLDGISAIETIRSGTVCPDIPILVLTAHATEVDNIRATQAGADACLVKPIKPDSLASTVNQVMRSRTKY